MDIPVFAAGGDGQCAALGASTLSKGSLYLNLGTALVGGLWSPTSELSSHWRTLISPTGSGYLLETVQKAGTYLIDWLLSNFSAGGLSASNFALLQAEIADIPIGSGGVLMCPYLLGCMDPHWDAEAKATITGLGSSHRLAHVYRAALEAMTLELVRSLQQMRSRGLSVDKVMAIGGGAENAVWLQMIADAGNVEVVRGLSNQASSLGAAMSAAVGLGWYTDFHSASTGMVKLGRRWIPRQSHQDEWIGLSERQSKIYLMLHD